MLAAFATFVAASTVIVLFPGPDTLVVLRSLLVGGRRVAAFTACGILTGLVIWVAAAALGLDALLRASHDGYLALRIAGATYLVALGVKALLARPGDAERAATPHRHRSLLGSGYRAGLVTDLLNPKVGVFFVTFLPGFVPHGEPVGLVSLALGAIFVVETALYLAIMIVASERVTRVMMSPRARRRIDRFTGVVLVGFGLRLALES